MRRREERRRKDELIIVSSDNTSSLQHPTPITESGHIAITKFGHAMAHLPTIVVYVNKHTQKIYGNKTHHQRTTKPTLANVGYTSGNYGR